MVRRLPGRRRINAIEPEAAQIQRLHEHIDRANRIALVDPIVETFRQSRLLAIRRLKETLHHFPANSARVAGFHTAWTHSGSRALITDACYLKFRRIGFLAAEELPMNTISQKLPLDAEEPQALVLGDSIVDWLVYDERTENAEKSLAWTSPLSRDDWYHSEGFNMHQCVAGAAAIHAMLWANNIPVSGSAFREHLRLSNTGSIFVLRKRANAGGNEEERTREYLPVKSPGQSWQKLGKLKEYAKVSIDRKETWRVEDSLLRKRKVKYADFFDFSKEEQPTSVQAICLWDVNRGFFPVREDEIVKWKDQQRRLIGWYVGLGSMPPIIIRTSDPNRFGPFLRELAKQAVRPTVVLVCALTQLDDGNLRGSGTWSDVWALVYDYLKRKRYSYLFKSADDWGFHVVVPVYEDGVIWIGPGCWPIQNEDRKHESLRDDKRPLGRLFALPGAQPGLSEFEEHSRTIGVHTLLTHAILEQLVKKPKGTNFDLPIRLGLMRSSRLRSRGYCDPEELFKIEDRPNYHIGLPREVWKEECRDATDLLLLFKIKDAATKQRPGPYEVECKFASRESTGLRIFTTMEKKIEDEFVASPKNCICVAGDVKEIPDFKKMHWIPIEGNKCMLPLDSFARNEIETFKVRQRISMQFGNFAMADPDEAAPILDLAQRIRQHVLCNRYNSPNKASVFNFALFGSPGSGKSFLAREIARSIDPNGLIFSQDEYNLSQFTDLSQLTDAFEAIASKSVGGKVPFVLWDEFDTVIDSQRGGWLARFLMPMQDAHFFEDRERRPIGTAVFVFIGGTFPTAMEFRNWACQTKKEGEKPPESVLLKARDFHSRLYTALDMPSILEEDTCPNDHSGRRCQNFSTEWDNSYTKLARAVLLREFFRKKPEVGNKVFLTRVHPDLCRFLLAIPLRHGARSLQRIVEACLVSKPSSVSMLHLPPPHFLAEHIETNNVRRGKRIGMTIEEMLAACRSRN